MAAQLMAAQFIRPREITRTVMTSKAINKTTDDGTLERFPDYPPRDDMQNSLYLDAQAHQASLHRHLGGNDAVIVLSEIPVNWNPGQQEGHRIPDLLVAFEGDLALAIEQKGYSIRAQGKPPDLVLEVASPSTGRADYTEKRDDYAAFGIPEYWRFDPSGGRHHGGAPLAGDRLVDEAYQPIEINLTDETHLWGHSDVLNLDFCWEDGQLRWWDPAVGRYLRTFDETDEERAAEKDARLASEARVRELEAELARRGEEG